MDASLTVTLTPALQNVIARLPEPVFAERLGAVYLACSRALGRLHDLDLSRFERSAVRGSPDHQLWDELGALICGTLDEVNAVLSEVQSHFPLEAPRAIPSALAEALETPGPLTAPLLQALKTAEAERHVRAVETLLALEVSRMGERFKGPRHGMDRWTVLADIQAFRARFRLLVIDLVHGSARVFAPLARQDVIPGQAEELRDSLLLREKLADLCRATWAHYEDFSRAETDPLASLLQLRGDVETFERTPAWPLLRAQDKRSLLEAQSELERLISHPDLPRDDAASFLRRTALVTETFLRVNHREGLLAHDRALRARVLSRLAPLEALFLQGASHAGVALADALHQAQPLYGRDPLLDLLLRRARQRGLAGLTPAQQAGELAKLRELLSAVHVP
ncbi:MAG: hypothetical protein FJ086_03105 [Deltaproteobacteria bacterium]|nr:hypothetical protein [Deltaproteobacteria bacterium]